ncbi:zinc phosphodiesterase elac protein [Blastocystis sp. subtype 4]|uniref:zinc phosphodiesterase elac protein n=1 Tax=Blastocystis sp. subtype 4 TaxID=944170 RepID=UPI0007122BED|nr:zinc phosphodiesterase elac protein [Blastocystis sp. subtype 4]KNB44284.1 zinc phosphodiesterase elac protein [Blastocystis sp. subtype 4]|eukprot:XP_014527727.1 zinc phosphodiesterase elac protein [Blastocystis sp. subtype 4]
MSPETLGGLPGMLLTIYDMGLRELKIYGPEGLSVYMDTLQLFINRPDYVITVIEIEEDMDSIELDNDVVIRPFVIHPTPSSLAFTRKTSQTPYSLNLSFSLVQRETALYGSEISYLIDIPRIKGKFCPDKARALGIPKGILFKTLSMGGEVEIGDKVITSDMVMTPPTRGPIDFESKYAIAII